MPIRIPLNRSFQSEEKSDYGNFSKSKIITLFQVPHYEHLQILICNDNSLTTLAGVEHIKHLWKLDVSNNQIRSLQHLSRFIALGSLNLSKNQLQWIELQHIRHMMILELRLDGNRILDADPNYRQHVLDCLPRIWMCDGIFISTAERNQVEEFFTQSSLTQKPVRHKLARDVFLPTNLKDRSINGLFGSKAMDLFAKFPVNCFVNADLDKKRIKHLASTFQDLILAEIRHDDEKSFPNDQSFSRRDDDFLNENRHILYHMMDIRQNHIEEFNMFLILLLTDLLFRIPENLLANILDVTHLNSIENLKLNLIFSSTEQLKCQIASLLHAGTRIDRDENHPSAYYDKLFQSLSIVLTNEIRQFSSSNPFPTPSTVGEAKTMICLEVMQVFIMCPTFYTMIKNSNVSAILQQALDQSPAFESIRSVLESLNSEEKSPDEQRDLLGPILGNIIKMTIRTFSTKRTKKSADITTKNENDSTTKRDSEVNASASPRPKPHRVPMIGDRILIAPQTFGRIVTMPDGDIAMIQLDNILAINGSMITNGSLNDHTNYVSINNFEWDIVHEYWKPKNTHGDRITLQMSTNKVEPMRSVASLAFHPSRTLTSKVPEGLVRPRGPTKVLEINLRKPKEAFIDPPRPPTPPLISISSASEENSLPTTNPVVVSQEIPISASQEMPNEHPLSVRISKQNGNEETSNSPVLIESMLLLMPDQTSSPMQNSQTRPIGLFSTMATINDFDQSSIYRRTTGKTNTRVHVPVKNASSWFNGPDIQNERTERMEKVVSGLVRRSARPTTTTNMPRVPILNSPSSRDHALYKGTRPGTIPDFCLESQRIAPGLISTTRFSQSPKDRFGPTSRSYDPNRTYHSSPNVFAMKSLANQPCPTPSWL